MLWCNLWARIAQSRKWVATRFRLLSGTYEHILFLPLHNDGIREALSLLVNVFLGLLPRGKALEAWPIPSTSLSCRGTESVCFCLHTRGIIMIGGPRCTAPIVWRTWRRGPSSPQWMFPEESHIKPWYIQELWTVSSDIHFLNNSL